VRFTVRWTITDIDATAIAGPPAHAWQDSLHQDGVARLPKD
jgi:hypothetical protein